MKSEGMARRQHSKSTREREESSRMKYKKDEEEEEAEARRREKSLRITRRLRTSLIFKQEDAERKRGVFSLTIDFQFLLC